MKLSPEVRPPVDFDERSVAIPLAVLNSVSQLSNLGVFACFSASFRTPEYFLEIFFSSQGVSPARPVLICELPEEASLTIVLDPRFFFSGTSVPQVFLPEI